MVKAASPTDPPISVVVPLLQEFPAAIERLGVKLDDLTREVIRAQQGIERLVAMEDERRVAERQMEALAVALTPERRGFVYEHRADGTIVEHDPDGTSSTIAASGPIDWYRDIDGTYRVRAEDGSNRPMTPAEIKAVTTPSRPR